MVNIIHLVSLRVPQDSPMKTIKGGVSSMMGMEGGQRGSIHGKVKLKPIGCIVFNVHCSACVLPPSPPCRFFIR